VVSFAEVRADTGQQKKFLSTEIRGRTVRVRYCGVDPGLSGAVAFIRPDAAHPGNRLAVFDAPLVGGEFDGVAFAKLLAHRLPDMITIEHAFSRPGQGVASTFKFGKTFGQALGVIQALGIPYELVSPTTWKKHCKISPSSPKDASRLVCKRLYPDADIPLKKHHGRADAILIAHYAWRRSMTMNRIETEVFAV
jgi:crossover junction endodeoxyribonuclease RuvC